MQTETQTAPQLPTNNPVPATPHSPLPTREPADPLAAPNQSRGGSTCLAALLDPPQSSPENLPALLPTAPQLPATSNLQLAPGNPAGLPDVVDTHPVAGADRRKRRHGRVASLPKIQRDMVNRMLSNGVAYKNIVAALDEADFTLSERNISNWVLCGGYQEWRFQQDLVLQNRLDQDHLVDHLRREDASELPEVGLQAAATRLSQILVEKTANAAEVEAHLGTFSQMVDILSRLNRELTTLQKQRDDSRRSLGRAYNPARIKDTEEFNVIDNERYFSNPPSDSKLAKPAEPPLLPPIPTASILADADREQARNREADMSFELQAILRGLNGQKAPATPNPLPPAEAARKVIEGHGR